MFGGHAIYVDGTIVAIVLDDVLYFKTDDDTRPAFAERELEPFSYESRGKVQRTSYFRAPDDALESPAAMREWLRRALSASLRSGAAKRKRRSKSTKSKG